MGKVGRSKVLKPVDISPRETGTGHLFSYCIFSLVCHPRYLKLGSFEVKSVRHSDNRYLCTTWRTAAANDANPVPMVCKAEARAKRRQDLTKLYLPPEIFGGVP